MINTRPQSPMYRESSNVSGNRYELLITRASARSLDLKQLAGEASKVMPVSRKRREMMEKLFKAPIRETVKSKETHTTRRAYYTHAELAQSLAYAGVKGAPFLAAMYSDALDGTVRTSLYRKLRERCAETATLEEWPERIQGMRGGPHHYEDELTALVLDADWGKALFQLAQSQHNVCLYAVAMDVSEETWQSKLMPYYTRILRHYETWLAQARGAVHRKLVEEYEHGCLPPSIPAARKAVMA